MMAKKTSMTGSLLYTFPMFDRLSIMHVDEINEEIVNELEEKIYEESTLAHHGYWTSDLCMFTREEKEENKVVFYLARNKDNLIFDRFTEASKQLWGLDRNGTRHYIIKNKEAIEAIKDSATTERFVIDELFPNIRDAYAPTSFSIDTKNYTNLNAAQRRLAERSFGGKDAFEKAMSTLNKVGLQKYDISVSARRYVLPWKIPKNRVFAFMLPCYLGSVQFNWADPAYFKSEKERKRIRGPGDASISFGSQYIDHDHRTIRGELTSSYKIFADKMYERRNRSIGLPQGWRSENEKELEKRIQETAPVKEATSNRRFNKRFYDYFDEEVKYSYYGLPQVSEISSEIACQCKAAIEGLNKRTYHYNLERSRLNRFCPGNNRDSEFRSNQTPPSRAFSLALHTEKRIFGYASPKEQEKGKSSWDVYTSKELYMHIFRKKNKFSGTLYIHDFENKEKTRYATFNEKRFTWLKEIPKKTVEHLIFSKLSHAYKGTPYNTSLNLIISAIESDIKNEEHYRRLEKNEPFTYDTMYKGH